MPINYALTYLDAQLVEESPYAKNHKGGHGEELCCDIMGELVLLSNSFVDEFVWDKLSSIPLYNETRKEILEHACK